MRDFRTQPNVDLTDPVKYPDGRIKNNTGSGNGTGVNEAIYGDIYQFFLKLKRKYGIIPNGLPDNETNGYQLETALYNYVSRSNVLQRLDVEGGLLKLPFKLLPIVSSQIDILFAFNDYAGETQIKGSDNVIKPVIVSGEPYKTGDYVMSIFSFQTNTLNLTKIINGQNIANSLISLFDSDEDLLATQLINGIMSSTDKASLDSLKTIRGFIDNVQPGTSTFGTLSDNIDSITPVSSTGYTRFRVVLTNPVLGIDGIATENYNISVDYQVKGSVSVQSYPILYAPLTKVINNTTFDILVRSSDLFPGSSDITLNFQITLP